MLAIILAVKGGLGLLAPIAFGATLTAMVYACGHVSGAHFNPAVTLAIFIRGKCAARDIPGYIIGQVAGAMLAVVTSAYLLGEMDVAAIQRDPVLFVPGVLAEFIGTFALCWVILNVAFSNATKGNSYYGLAIGLTVTGCSYLLSGVSGAAFNPAVALSMSFTEMTSWSNMGMFLTGQISAAIVAALAFNKVNGNDQ